MTSRSFFISTTRIEAFSDGVFAIVITLLAFQFKVPKFTTEATIQQNLHELVKLSPHFIGFVFSFLFVAVFWINHHQLFHTIKEADRKLLWYNIHMLFWITIIPFPTAMVGDHPEIPLAAMSLAFVLMMSSLAAYIVRRYSYFKASLVDESLSIDSIKDGLNKNIAAIILNFTAILVAPYSVKICYIIFIIVLALFIIPQKLERKSKSSSSKNKTNET
ncbi:MAG: TMEM175 family protein [Ferruginibacter sp.]